MKKHCITLYDIALRYIGIKEVQGAVDNPFIMAALTLDGQKWPKHDEVPWCSAIMQLWTWHLRLPRSKNLRARSWLDVGTPLKLSEARVGYDIVILERPPDPEAGHVALFAGWKVINQTGGLYLLGGNQSNMVSVALADADRVIGVRRLWE